MELNKEQKNAETTFKDAMEYFSKLVETKLKNKEIKERKKELLNALEDKLIDGAARKHIIITSDPMEEFDDLVMIRFVLYNLSLAKITVILSGGAHTPQKRLDNVRRIFDKFTNAEMYKPMDTKTGTITFYPDDTDRDLEPCDLFVNCGPTTLNTLTQIVKAMKQDSNVITVGANMNGTASEGINQKFVVNNGHITNKEAWNNNIQLMKDKGCIITNLSLDISRYVLFPNPKSMSDTPYGKLADTPDFFDEAVATTGMFIASRPPPKFGGRVNFSNSVIDYQLCKNLLENPLENENYQNGLENIAAYSKFSKTPFHTDSGHYGEEGEEKSPDFLAAIPLMCTALMGGIRRKGTEGKKWFDGEQTDKNQDILAGDGGYFFGSVPTDRNSKMQMAWVEGGKDGKFGKNVETLSEFTPAYDPLAVLMGISMLKLKKTTGGKKFLRKTRKNTKKNTKKKHIKKIKSRRSRIRKKFY